MAWFLKFIISLLAPVALVAGGGAIAGWGLTNEYEWAMWIGGALFAAGVIWGLFLLLVASDGPSLFG